VSGALLETKERLVRHSDDFKPAIAAQPISVATWKSLETVPDNASGTAFKSCVD